MTAQPSFPDVIYADELVRHRNGMWISPGRWSKADNWIITEVLVDDVYALAAMKTAPKTILDIGAHIGAFAVACHQYWPDAQIICVEPNHMLWSALVENTRNWVKELIWAGIGKPAGPSEQLFFRSSMTSDGSGGRDTATSVTFTTPQPDSPTLPAIPCVGLDALFQRFDGPPDLLKIDCEGCERDILTHWLNLVLECQEVRMEWHDPNTKQNALQLLGEKSMEWNVHTIGLRREK